MAGLQRGVVANWQLELAGIGRGSIRRRREHGQLHRLLHGAHLFGHAVPPVGALEDAALLACRRNAAIAGGSAAWLHEFGLTVTTLPGC